jgi:hypothetical protein
MFQMDAPVVASQMRTVLSLLSLKIRVPSGEKATVMTLLVCPVRVLRDAPVAASQMRTVQSSLPLAIFMPSGRARGDGPMPRDGADSEPRKPLSTCRNPSAGEGVTHTVGSLSLPYGDEDCEKTRRTGDQGHLMSLSPSPCRNQDCDGQRGQRNSHSANTLSVVMLKLIVCMRQSTLVSLCPPHSCQ